MNGLKISALSVTLLITLCVSPILSYAESVYNESRALLIGINKYKHLPPQSQLQFAVNDVMSMRQLLVEEFGFREDHIITLIDEQATKHAIENAMSQLTDTKQIHENDRVLTVVCDDDAATACGPELQAQLLSADGTRDRDGG